MWDDKRYLKAFHQIQSFLEIMPEDVSVLSHLLLIIQTNN
jgi:hypothetical protein